ncbi:MAG: hypothetical protein J6C97_00200, partial [Clostridia bacterium]|nr:hypothetical protein [Clostridia bacterium]
LDFVALATVADSMELVGENRDLVAEGLKLFKNPRPQFKALMELSKAKEVNSVMLAFNIAPKVNACGRMGNAKLGLKLMLSQDLSEIFQIAEELITYNQERQSVCESLYLSAKQKLAETDLNSAVITLYDESWHGGLVGIVAAKIAEEYNRPTIMFAKTEDGLKGSARSIEGVNLYQAIEACSSYLLGFGGHSQAAGVSILQENLGAFNSALNSYVCKFFGDKFVKQTVVEEFIKEPITILEGKQLSLLEPFGTGNKKPIFAIRGDSFKINRLSGEHISLKTDYLDLLYFNGLSKTEELANSYTKSIVVELNYSVFNNKESVKGFVKNYEVVLQDDIKDSLVLFQTYLEGLLQEDMPCEMAEKEHIDDFIDKFLALPYGTIFAVADPKNLQYYTKLKNLPIEFSFNLTDNLLNKIVVGYKGENKYKQVVYLDNCTAFKSGIKCTTIKPFADLTLDRNSVARVFSAFNNVYKSVEDLICKNPSLNPYELVFAYCVLKELKIINHNQYIVKDSSVKNQITNSKIYNKFQTR